MMWCSIVIVNTRHLCVGRDGVSVIINVLSALLLFVPEELIRWRNIGECKTESYCVFVEIDLNYLNFSN